MTKIAIFRDPRPIPEVENTAYLKLTQASDYVLLSAVNERGNHAQCGNLLKIFADGTFVVVDSGEIDKQEFRARFPS